MKRLFLLLAVPLVLLSGCASDSPSYSANSIGQVSNIEQGKIIDIQKVNIKGKDNVGSRVGGLAGGLGGALAGSGGMLTSIAGSIGGAIVGGIAGGATEKVLTSSEAYQFVIQLKDGKSIAVLQEEVKGLNIGDNVTILASGNNTRIIPQNKD
jgi:outer membrane lipoprotein SlyB